jgi:hypothetical protein
MRNDDASSKLTRTRDPSFTKRKSAPRILLQEQLRGGVWALLPSIRCRDALEALARLLETGCFGEKVRRRFDDYV